MNDRKFLKGKKILLTSFSYALFGGAELNPIELAEQLLEFGAKPYFFSYDIDGPLAKYIHEKFNTTVLTDSVYYLAENEGELENTPLDIHDYDYVWVGGNVVPIALLKQINAAKSLPKFIFIHMSALPAYPLDAPLLPELEARIASRILSLGGKVTTNCIYRILGENIPIGEWPNPVPRDFRLLKKRSGKLKSIAVISSSYPTDEVMNIKNQIRQHDIRIDYIGRFNNNAQVVDAAFYDKYDLVIGIGKNAKYSLVSGVPSYVYGRFGGSGYITENNYDINNDNNFSGRGFGKKTSRQIVHEIIDGYGAALAYHEKNREKFIENFSIDIAAERLFRELEEEGSKRVAFPEEYINWLVSMQINLMQRLQTSADVRRIQGDIQQLEAASTELPLLKSELAGFTGIKRSARLLMGNVKRRIVAEYRNVTRR